MEAEMEIALSDFFRCLLKGGEMLNFGKLLGGEHV